MALRNWRLQSHPREYCDTLVPTNICQICCLPLFTATIVMPVPCPLQRRIRA